MPIVLTRATKLEARYKALGGSEHCSACRFFMPQGTCGRIIGPVSPEGWCKFYSREAVQRWSNPGYAGSGGGLPPGSTLNLNFMTPGTLDPRITFTRASTGTYFDSTGTIQTAATNAPRWDYDPVSLQLRGLLLEDARTNGIRNSTMQGAVPGTPGTLPTNWSSAANSTGLSQQVVGTGTENGITYVDIRLFGTSGAGQYYFFFDTSTGIPAATGQVWAYTLYWRVAAGSFNGLSAPQLSVIENTVAGAGIRSTPIGIAVPTSASLSSQRPSSGGVTLSGGGTVGMVQPRMIITAPAVATVDVTLRFGGIQMEQGVFPTSYIPTTTAAVTRSIDSCLIPPANMSPWFVSPGGSWYAEFDYFAPAPNNSRVLAEGDSFSSTTNLFLQSSTILGQYNGVTALNGTTATPPNTIVKAASTWSASVAKLCANGGVVNTSAALTTGYPGLVTFGLGIMAISPGGGTGVTSGHIRRVTYWPRALSDTEMQQVTT